MKKKKVVKQFLISLLCSAMVAGNLTGIPFMATSVNAEEAGELTREEKYPLEKIIANPRDDETMNIYDVISFGSYFQEDTNEDNIVDETDEKTPILWRVISVDGDVATLMSEDVIDLRPFYAKEVADSEILTYENSDLRSWLNGYDEYTNLSEVDYSTDNFIDQAFTLQEQNQILTSNIDSAVINSLVDQNTLLDKVYLPSIDELKKMKYKEYASFYPSQKAYTEYLKYDRDEWETYFETVFALRNVNELTKNIYYVDSYYTNDISEEELNDEVSNYLLKLGVRPMIQISLNNDLYTKYGCVRSHNKNSNVYKLCEEHGSSYKPSCNEYGRCRTCNAPIKDIKFDELADHFDYVTYDDYPMYQKGYVEPTETSEGYSGDILCSGCNRVVSEGNVIPKLNNNSYGLNNPVKSGGSVTFDTVYFGNYWQDDTNGDGVADTNDEKTPIKWRVLSVDGEKALLVADQNLDNCLWGEPNARITYENSTIRCWLNGLGADSHVTGKDFSQPGASFIDNAFNKAEQRAILTTELDNSDSFGDGPVGNNTFDKVFVLSYQDMTNTAYGYCYHPSLDENNKNEYDPARYRYATKFCADNYQNVYPDYNPGTLVENQKWMYGLRTMGTFTYLFGKVDASHSFVISHADGYDYNTVNNGVYGVVPAIYLDLSTSNSFLWNKGESVVLEGVPNDATESESTIKDQEEEHETKVEISSGVLGYKNKYKNISVSNKTTPVLFRDICSTAAENAKIDYFKFAVNGDYDQIEEAWLVSERGGKKVSVKLDIQKNILMTDKDLLNDEFNHVIYSEDEQKNISEACMQNCTIVYTTKADKENVKEMFAFDFVWKEGFNDTPLDQIQISVDKASITYNNQVSNVDINKKVMETMTYIIDGFGKNVFNEVSVTINGDTDIIEKAWIVAQRHGTNVSEELIKVEDNKFVTQAQFYEDVLNGITYKRSELNSTPPRNFSILVKYFKDDSYHLLYNFKDRWIVDPNGHAYEAVPSNPLEGVTATIWGSDFADGSDPYEFEAEYYGQVNPQITGEDGFYAWDVPKGYWQVRLSKEGYQPVASDWLPVPPPQLDVDLAMVDPSVPYVDFVELSKDSVFVRFNKYMDVDSVSLENITFNKSGDITSSDNEETDENEEDENITVSNNGIDDGIGEIIEDGEPDAEMGADVSAELSIESIHPVEAENGLARDYELVFNDEISNEDLEATYDLSIAAGISYAGTQMEKAVFEGLQVVTPITAIEAEDKVILEGVYDYEVTLQPAEKVAGRKVTCSVDNDNIEVLSCGTCDENGKAIVRLKAVKSGVSMVTIGAEGSAIKTTAMMTVAVNDLMFETMGGKEEDRPIQVPDEETSTEPSPSTTPSTEPGTQPSETPEVSPSTVPSEAPSAEPSEDVSASPSVQPSENPSEEPSTSPVASPSPSEEIWIDPPYVAPSVKPSVLPSMQPSEEVSTSPSVQPSEDVSTKPSQVPGSGTEAATDPTKTPDVSVSPSVNPSAAPSEEVKITPSTMPSVSPSAQVTTSAKPDSTFVPKKIDITSISKKLAAGKKMTLTLNILPVFEEDMDVNWVSSNPKYATVDEKGVVQAKKAGVGKTVTITATVNGSEKVKGYYKIKIMKDSVKSVKLSAKSKSVEAGKSLAIKATVKTTGKKVNKKLVWTVSNEKYASISPSGKLKTNKKAKGKTITVTAKSTDGSNKIAKIKIKVK